VVEVGLRIVTAADREAGLPDLPVSEVEATSWDVFERGLGLDWRAPAAEERAGRRDRPHDCDR